MAQKKKRSGFFKSNYKESWNYIKESRNFIYVVVGVFTFFILLGSFFPIPIEVEKRIWEFITELVKKTQGMSVSELTKYIFFNNLQSSFLGMILGVALGFFSIFTVAVNGYLLGFVASRTVTVEGVFILWRLLPHGVFELPALIISLGLGLRLGSFVFQKQKVKSFKYYLLSSLRVFLFIILPLLLIAAIIEGSLIFLLPG